MKNLKSVKVFYHGVRMKDVYPHATTWQVIKYRIAKFFRKVVIASFIIGAIYGAFKVGTTTTHPVTVFADREVTIDRSNELLASKIDAMKTEVVETIRKCESAGYKESDGVIIFDSNAKASVGTLQFQVSTVKHYYKMFYGKDLTSKEAVLLALDDGQAGELAKKIMFQSKNKANDWHNCQVKHGVNAKIDVIKSLEK